MQVPTLEQHEALARQLAEALARIAKLEASQPDWLREDEAMSLTGLSRSTLIRERKKANTLLVVSSSGPLRYQRASVDEFNQARTLRKVAA